MVSETNDAFFWNDRKTFNGEMLEVEKEIEVKWTESDEARYTVKLNLRKIRDVTTEKEMEKVTAMEIHQRDRAQKSRDKVRLISPRRQWLLSRLEQHLQ
jgi:hypothetical protein